MGSFFYKAVFILILSFLNCRAVFSQIVDFDRENTYKKVFVDTDNFGVSYLDILEEAYLKSKPDSLRFSILNDLAYYSHTRNLITALKFAEQGLELTSLKNDTLWHGRFQITEGAILLRMERLDSAQAVLEAARNKVLPIDQAFRNIQLGYVYERKGRLQEAADYALDALKIGVELNNRKIMAIAYSDLSNLFWKQSKFETGLEYGLKSLKLFEERGITDLDYDFTLYVVGNNYLALKQYAEAQKYYEHAIIIGERYGFYNNLSDVYISLVDLYAYLNEFEKASKVGANAVKYAELLKNDFMEMRSWLSIGKMQNVQGKYTSAIESLKKSITIATNDFGDAYYLSQAYETLGKAYAGNHDYQEAYQAFAEYDALKSLIFTAEADQRTALLRTEFDVANKEGTILTQESELKKQQTRQTLITIIACLLFLLLVLSYKSIQNNRKKNELLRKQNREKEFLLKEIHHRVKNNLEIVSSLLSLQSAQTQDSGIVDAFEASKHRVHSMGMIHQKLYMGKNLAAIEMRDYFINLAEYSVSVFGVEQRVSVIVDMGPLELDVDMAIPIGLMVNELLTNAMKYAFPEGANGKIRISLKKIGQIFQLEVNDNGVGKSHRDEVHGTGFGTQLIALLTRQLDGKMTLKTDQGTLVSIQFQSSKAA